MTDKNGVLKYFSVRDLIQIIILIVMMSGFFYVGNYRLEQIEDNYIPKQVYEIQMDYIQKQLADIKQELRRLDVRTNHSR